MLTQQPDLEKNPWIGPGPGFLISFVSNKSMVVMFEIL